MKRLFCIMLVMIMALAMLGGCAEDGSGQNNGEVASGFAVGYGKADISPEQPVYLRGYGSLYEERTSTGVADPLFATCVAIRDASGNQALLISLDLLGADSGVVRPIREQLAALK